MASSSFWVAGTSTRVRGPTSPAPAPARSSRRCARRCGARMMAAAGPWRPLRRGAAGTCTGRSCTTATSGVIGAENGTPDDVWKSKDGVNWELVAATVPWQERGNQMVTVFDGSIWVMGGQAGAAGQTNFVADLKAGKPIPPAPPPLGDVWRTKDGLSWELVTDKAPWAPRGMITGANGGVPVLHGRMWILGGGYVGTGGTTLSSLRYDLEQQPRLKTRLFHNDVWSSTDGREWTCHIAEGKAPWPARSYHDTAAWDGKLWVLGGHRGMADHAAEVATDGNRNDVWYSADGEHWEELPNTPWSLPPCLCCSRPRRRSIPRSGMCGNHLGGAGRAEQARLHSPR